MRQRLIPAPATVVLGDQLPQARQAAQLRQIGARGSPEPEAQGFQPRQRRDLPQAGIRHGGPRQVQHLQVRKPANLLQARVRNVGELQAQPPQARQFSDRAQPFISDGAANRCHGLSDTGGGSLAPVTRATSAKKSTPKSPLRPRRAWRRRGPGAASPLVVIDHATADCPDARDRVTLLFCFPPLRRQPTTRENDEQGKHEQGANGKLKPQAQHEGKKEPEEHQQQKHPDSRHGDEHRPALVMVERKPLKPLGQPEEAFDAQKDREQCAQASEAAIGGGGRSRPFVTSASKEVVRKLRVF